MRKVVAAVAAAVFGGALATLSPGQAVPPGGVPATVEQTRDEASRKRYPTYDASGRRGRDASWTVTHAGGNCCEVYITATPSGRLVEFGGTYPTYSDDRGETWHRVRPVTPLVAGEGAISAAPGGDILGVGWDPYSGDHLQAFRYDAEARKWFHSEIPLHEPFYDRPWFAVLPGPFPQPDGTSAKYASVIRSNYLSSAKETFLVSFDGLTYVPTTALPQAVAGVGTTSRYLDPVAVPILDYLQPHRDSRLAPLAGGGVLAVTPLGSTRCPATIWSRTQQWSCYAMPNHRFVTNLVVDSRGWLHEIQPEDEALTYRVSNDGGRTWRETRLAPPDGVILEGLTLLDHKAHGAAGVAAVVARVTRGATAQDVVFRVDVTRPSPRLVETLYVGNGDAATGRGVTEAGARFDFMSVAILPDGTFAASFHDASSTDPALAVETRERRRVR